MRYYFLLSIRQKINYAITVTKHKKRLHYATNIN